MIKKILVVNVNWLGDCLFSSSVFRNLRQAYPEAHIACLAVPRILEILECIPSINEIIPYEEKGKHRWPWQRWMLARTLKRKQFDVVFLLHRSRSRAKLVKLAGIPKRVGYNEKERSRYLTHVVSSKTQGGHRADYYLNVIESFGVPIIERSSFITVDPQEAEGMKRKLQLSGLDIEKAYWVVNPGGNWNLKRWPKARFIQLVNRMVNEMNLAVCLTGAPKDQPLVADILKGVPQSVKSFAGQTSLKELMVLMKNAKGVISSDSGPLHVASSLGTPVVGIFGPTRPEVTGPRGNSKSIILQYDVGCNKKACYHLDCPDNICMKAVSVEKVMDALREIQST